MKRIVLADDDATFRRWMAGRLEREPDIDVVAEAVDGRDAIRQVREHRPDVVLMDVAMPEVNGVEATRRIVREFPRVKVIGLSMHAEGAFVDGMFDAGASGYLLKDGVFSELTEAVRSVAAGGTWKSPASD